MKQLAKSKSKYIMHLLWITVLIFPLAMGVPFAHGIQPAFEDMLDGQTSADEVKGGRFLDVGEGLAWSSSVGGHSRDTGSTSYLRYSIDNLDPSSGTLSFNVTRNNETKWETLFSIVDEQFNNIIAASLFYGREFPELILSMEDNRDVPWLTTNPHINVNGKPYSSLFILPSIAFGESVHFAFSWGSEKDDNAIYLNGQKITIVPEKTQTISEMFSRGSDIIVGAVLDGNGSDRAWNMMMSSISNLRVYPIPLNAYLEERRPVIKSVTHNAYEVAGYSGKLVYGDEITVSLKSETGGKAIFSIGEKVKDVPMLEDTLRPGTYIGTYTVEYGDAIEAGEVVARFSNILGNSAEPLAADRPVDIVTRVYMDVETSNDLVPADGSSRAGLTVVATDANGKAVTDHELKLTLSTTDEYTGNLGGITFEDLVGGELDVDWGGVTDSFGEVTAQYVSGFAAKTILVSAKDMASGDVGVGYVRSYIDGQVDIIVTEPQASALSVAGSMDVSLSRDWLTADGKSRSRITAVVNDSSGAAVSGHNVQFTLLSDNGEIRVVQSKTDSRGRALADYIAGIVMGQVQVEVRDLTSGMTAIVSIELRPDAPAEIELAADPGEVVTGGLSIVSATVTDANGNANRNVDVLYDVSVGEGTVSAPSVATDEKGHAPVTFTAGETAGLVTVRGTVISRVPTDEEVSAAEGAVFLYGLEEDSGRFEVVEWLVEVGDEVVESQDLVVLEARDDRTYTVVAPRDGTVAVFIAEERDRVEYGDTLGYILEPAE